MGKFTSKGIDTSDNFGTIPGGNYELVLVKAKKTKTLDGAGAYNNCQFKVVNNKEYKGRIVFHMFNLDNNSDQAVEIAEKQLAQFMNAVGVTTLKEKWDLTPLMNKVVSCRLSIEKSKGYNDKNKIQAFLEDVGKSKGKDKNKASSDSHDPFGDDKKGKKSKDKNKKGKKGKKGKKEDDDIPF